MHVDLRFPTLVVTGAWNPAIFSTEWIASELFGKATGQTIEVLQLVNVGRPDAPVAQYIDGIGIACTPQRLELYVNEASDAAFAKAEALATKALTVLGHTPLDALGINFAYRDETISEMMQDMLETREGLEGGFKVLSRSATSQLDLGDGCILNWLRRVDPAGFFAELNFHHPGLNKDNFAARIGGSLSKYKKQATQFMERYYGASEIVEIGHDPVAAHARGEADVQN